MQADQDECSDPLKGAFCKPQLCVQKLPALPFSPWRERHPPDQEEEEEAEESEERTSVLKTPRGPFSQLAAAVAAAAIFSGAGGRGKEELRSSTRRKWPISAKPHLQPQQQQETSGIWVNCKADPTFATVSPMCLLLCPRGRMLNNAWREHGPTDVN